MILVVLHNFGDGRAQLNHSAPGQAALEHRKLQPLAAALHCLEQAPPALLVADVVSDDPEVVRGAQARLPRRDVGQVRDLPGKEPPEQPGLHLEQTAVGDPVPEHRMGDLLV